MRPTPNSSGGGLYLSSEEGGRLVGITSYGSLSHGYGSYAGFLALEPHIEWINSTIASVDPSISGDYDKNGVVEQADYSVWEASYGEYGVALAADGNLDGRVDAADYAVWRDANAASAVSVPEPAAHLLALGIFAWSWSRYVRPKIR
ncbi:hypothetical protein MalM25_23940 [Planctomycetes bacterium MalM25]|nr:hypothetical protein MalM25_23940 [Planctomycetes bacterium MalM25]